ncbi:hypothetical protein GGS23DRAFT_26578 [Durotheca rogersii]|uniref:uncharacterized protein n=1 Tax=Durotheca rogersii TaxID=419775 RepID=UPI00221F2586|nr:uncharacterized protein GGS23DRAFT_26578 [Durotheca rogersii]KAI5868379.1 hypothetical protein GGS23DRAFT_26578 [Durotheca rogersii]
MTTIEEDEMEYINWEAAAAGTGFEPMITSEGVTAPILAPVNTVAGSSSEPNMDLVFENVEGDDWSYWALEHFEATQAPQDIDTSAAPEPEPVANSALYWETPEAPCTNCALGGYQCKRIREGKYRGYCTSCVALRRECSFGPSVNNLTAETGATFPANPWPVMGDRPETSIVLEDELAAMITSAPSMPGLFATADDGQSSSRPQNMPKIGARFSRESVKVLKNWLSTHSRHPYPTEEEKEGLQKVTGLSKVQITNWLANARRRGKVQPTRATSPHVGRGYAQAIDIPQRRGMPGFFENMNPLQRWANSPPENEPASVAAIARAVSASSNSYSQTSGSGRNSPFISNYSDDGSSRSLCNQSSASSLGTSGSSGGSFASAYSNKSHGSLGSVPSFVRTRGRRRRRRAPPKRTDESSGQPVKAFQCTFCTETFRTKHDWQRHEKSLHLSLERWICSPDGPRAVNPDNGILSCVFCGEANPDDSHVESHNFSSCTERTPEERTFYRKDHLRQHLKLVHNVKFLSWAMDKWRVASPEIRSRCGFCGVVLDSWTIRIDHLAEHFKTGNTMADWKGDWGFEAPVLEMVENSIPPYLIHDERNTPLPIVAHSSSQMASRNVYELLKVELDYWMSNYTTDNGNPPTDAEIQHEACCIIFEAEAASEHLGGGTPSWLRDLIMSSEEQTRNAAFRPMRGQGRISSPRVNGNGDVFENCQFEKQLQDFVKAKQLLGLTAMDHELQVEACHIIGRIEEKSGLPVEGVANWLLRLINQSAKWLQAFRQRAHLPRSEDLQDVDQRSKDPKTIDSTVHNYSRLDRELGEYLQEQRSLGIEPSNADLQRKARIIIYELDDEWNQTAADDKDWIECFRQRYPRVHATPTTNAWVGSPTSGRLQSPLSQNLPFVRDSEYLGPLLNDTAPCRKQHARDDGGNAKPFVKTGHFFLNDANCYNRLARGLTRYVKSTMSPNNPSRHVPTDEELQYQARWLVYDDDDPWNQTAADNFEWLQRFKRDAGILPAESGPGLGMDAVSWALSQGGTGFAPPYVAPNPAAQMEPFAAAPAVFLREGARRRFAPAASTANRFLRSFTQRYPAPAKVFCSRELENGLTAYVRREVAVGGAAAFPDDDQLRDRARQIMAMQRTACDDPVLLERFKAAVRESLGAPEAAAAAAGTDGSALRLGTSAPPFASSLTASLASATAATATAHAPDPLLASDPFLAPDPLLTSDPMLLEPDVDLDLNLTEQEMNDILRGLSPSTGSGAPSNSSPAGAGAPGSAPGAGR